MKLLIEEGPLGGNDLLSYLVMGRSVSIAAIENTLPYDLKRCQEIQNYGLWMQLSSTEERAAFWTHSLEQLDISRVGAARRIVEDLEPNWIARVKNACKTESELFAIADESGLDAKTTQAIIEVLQERGELPRRTILPD